MLVKLIGVFFILQFTILAFYFVSRSNKGYCSLENNVNIMDDDEGSADEDFLVKNYDHFSRHHNSLYSSHYCTGGENEFGEVNPFQRRCVFKNVVWARRKRTLVYNQDPTLPFVNFSLLNVGLAVNIQVEINAKSPATPPPYNAQSCHVFSHECNLGIKVGHDFDSVWNAFQALLSLRMLSKHNPVIVMGKIHKTGIYPPISKMWATLSGAGAMRGEYFKPEHLTLACVVVTNRHHADVTFPTFTSSYIPQLYLQRALHLLALPSPPAPLPLDQAPRILVRYKEGTTHGFTPHDEIMQYIREIYPNCIVQELVATRESSLEEEIKLITQTAVYLTPGGGGSFTGIFLPPSATAIYGNVCWKGNNPTEKNHTESFGLELIRSKGMFVHCVRQDNLVWTLFNHYEKRYMSAQFARDIYGPVNFTRKVYNRVLRHSFRPDNVNLRAFIDEALIRSGFAQYATNFEKVVW